MKVIDIIEKKRDGEELTREEILYFIDAFMNKKVTDAQAGAFLMAVTENGFSIDEAYYYSYALASSGTMFKISSSKSICVDKHSTGGIFDVCSLVVVPVLASLGYKVAKFSSPGFGVGSSTLYRLSIFDGYTPSISLSKFSETLATVGASIIGENDQIVPADKLLFEIRRQTGTIPSIPLIACSVMAKKICMGVKALVLDVKCGEGSLVDSYEQAEELAKLMVAIGKRAGIKTTAILSNLNQPLGNKIGPSLEVKEAIELLSNKNRIEYESDLYKMCREMCFHILVSTGKCVGRGSSYKLFDDAILSGRALTKFRQMIEAHGGSVKMIDEPELLSPKGAVVHIRAEKSGYIEDIDTKGLYKAINIIGGGNIYTGDKIKLDMGVELLVREGDKVKEGNEIARVYYNMSDPSFSEAVTLIKKCFKISKNEPICENLILKVIV